MKATKTVIIILLTLTALAALTQTAHAQTTPTYENTQTWQKWVQAYKILAELSRADINVTQYTQKLRQALQAMEQGNYQQAQNIINQIIPQLQQLQANKENYILTENIKKYVTATTIFIIPLLFYYLFPRAYLKIFHRIRKKWTVIKA